MRNLSSFALAFAFVMPLAGCPGDDTGDTGASTTVNPTTDASATEASATEASATEATATDATATDATATADTTDGGGGAGFCASTCEVAADCAGVGSADDWACTDGFCEYTGEIVIPECDETNCPEIAGFACAQVDGVNTCTTPCDDDSACFAGFTECTGTDDAGNEICAAIPCFGAAEGAPCEIDDFGQVGVCSGGECSCSDDAECTATGQACNN